MICSVFWIVIWASCRPIRVFYPVTPPPRTQSTNAHLIPTGRCSIASLDFTATVLYRLKRRQESVQRGADNPAGPPHAKVTWRMYAPHPPPPRSHTMPGNSPPFAATTFITFASSPYTRRPLRTAPPTLATAAPAPLSLSIARACVRPSVHCPRHSARGSRRASGSFSTDRQAEETNAPRPPPLAFVSGRRHSLDAPVVVHSPSRATVTPRDVGAARAPCRRQRGRR